MLGHFPTPCFSMPTVAKLGLPPYMCNLLHTIPGSPTFPPCISHSTVTILSVTRCKTVTPSASKAVSFPWELTWTLSEHWGTYRKSSLFFPKQLALLALSWFWNIFPWGVFPHQLICRFQKNKDFVVSKLHNSSCVFQLCDSSWLLKRLIWSHCPPSPFLPSKCVAQQVIGSANLWAMPIILKHDIIFLVMACSLCSWGRVKTPNQFANCLVFWCWWCSFGCVV